MLTTLWKSLGLIGCAAVLLLSMGASILFGQTPIQLEEAVSSFTQYDESSNAHIIVQTTRVPRAYIAAAVGASLAIAGALMQVLTRNALASPGILGLNAGAAFFVVLGITVLSVGSPVQIMLFALLGAGVAAGAVFFLGTIGRDGLTPLKIVLGGAAITALFSSFTQGLLVINEKGLDEVLFWLTGSIAGRTMELLELVLPYIAICWLGALLLSRDINLLLLGDDTAKGVGQKTARVKILATIIFVVLAGCSVAVAGPIGFIGLIVPHIARFVAGNDYRWLLPYGGFIGATLLVLADVAARFVIMPEELPVGVMTAIIGAPFFLYIARKGLKS